MKWTTEQIDRLKELCMAGMSNKDIAAELGIEIKYVYAKRSQLGITIDKCKREQVPIPQKKSSLTKAFNKLEDELLCELARAPVNEMGIYVAYGAIITDLYSSLKESLKIIRSTIK